MAAVTPSLAESLAERALEFRHDPWGFVLWNFPWGEGELEGRLPYDWQRELLEYIGEQLRIGALDVQDVIQAAIASGHGIGKSALVAWLIIWAVSTYPMTRGVVTANTEAQLRSKTWAELGKWHTHSLMKDAFRFTATSYYANHGDEATQKNWRVDLIPWSENNSEAFAGLHNAGKRILLIFDEASAIPNIIHETAEGALTDEDTEIIWCMFGNPTRNQGRFHEAIFGGLRHRWWHRSIDSRTVPGTNKRQIQKWLEDRGEDSDFFRIRVLGQAPNAAYNQFIERDLITNARNREMYYVPPKVACVGVDVARFGDDDSVIFTRIGRDARSVPVKRFHGLDNMQLAGRVAEHVNYLRSHLGLRVVLYVDGGQGGGVVDRLRELGYEVIEVLFGSAADNPRRYANKRTEMYGRAREWLKVGYLDADAGQLEEEMCAILYQFQRDAFLLERKEKLKDREGFSPDEADAFVCTFAYPVPPVHMDEAPGQAVAPSGRNSAGTTRRNYNPRTGGRRAELCVDLLLRHCWGLPPGTSRGRCSAHRLSRRFSAQPLARRSDLLSAGLLQPPRHPRLRRRSSQGKLQRHEHPGQVVAA